MMHRSLVVIVAVTALAASTSVLATTLLDQPPTGSAGGIFSDEGLNFSVNGSYSQTVAENFQVITGGTGFSLEEVVVWGGFQPYLGSSFPAWNDVDVLVHADAGGLPGTVLCSESGVAALREATGVTLGTPPNDFDEYRVALPLFEPCGLSDGTYWVEVYYNTGVGYDDWFWEIGTQDAVYGLPSVAYASENPGEHWSAYDNPPLSVVAVQLNGTLGTVTCVSTAAELQAALTAAGSDGADDFIQVVEENYATPGSPFTYSTSESYDLHLVGGYSPGCTDRTMSPSGTVLDGVSTNPVLRLLPGSGTNGALVVRGLTLTNGVASGTDTAGLDIGGAGYNGRVTVANTAIVGNLAADGAAGISAQTGGALVNLFNTLIADNASTNGSGAGTVTCDGETIHVTNSTIAGNSCTSCDGGLVLGGTVAPYISNSILWGNDGHDLTFTSTATSLQHNDIGSMSGTPTPTGSSGNLSLDPQFAGDGDYRLTVDSPLIDQGTSAVAGGLPTHDLDNRPRIQHGEVDMGAYELPLIFMSDFESSDTTDWSLVAGESPPA